MEIQPVFVVAKIRKCSIEKQPTRVVPGKKCSENMQRNYRRTPMPKCDFNKVAKLKQLYWNRTSAWVFSCKFAAYFQNTFFKEHLWVAASVNIPGKHSSWWRRLEDAICFRHQKTSWRVLEGALIKTSITCFREVLQRWLSTRRSSYGHTSEKFMVRIQFPNSELLE